MLPIRRIAATLPIALLVLASSARADFAYNYYEGSWSSIPNFDSMTPVDSGLTPTVDLSMVPPGRTYEFGLQLTGTLIVQQAGTYAFSTTSDDGSDLRIDNQLVVDNNGVHTAQKRDLQQEPCRDRLVGGRRRMAAILYRATSVRRRRLECGSGRSAFCS